LSCGCAEGEEKVAVWERGSELALGTRSESDGFGDWVSVGGVCVRGNFCRRRLAVSGPGQRGGRLFILQRGSPLITSFNNLPSFLRINNFLYAALLVTSGWDEMRFEPTQKHSSRQHGGNTNRGRVGGGGLSQPQPQLCDVTTCH
jgi:hypothetical protein